ncbi:MAG TPA: LysM peptidoglycan-binding domain-containing protein [Anaerolineales bacterium]|nr:LysM peptidoglycan-binding domain-containing protein [Anaerolineales bacterium]
MFASRAVRLTLILVLLVSFFAVTHNVSAAGPCGSTYVVQPGDWLSKIANRCGVSLSSLYAANPYVGYYIYPGQVLNIPGGPGGYHGPVPGNGAPNPGPWHPWGGHGQYYCGPTYSQYYGNYYVVCRGDSLLKIALYYGERLSYMQWHNHIWNADRIYVGQFIFP